ncbi:MAG: hypothetical protein ACKPER_22930, partial [Dolichospermum sp.]
MVFPAEAAYDIGYGHGHYFSSETLSIQDGRDDADLHEQKDSFLNIIASRDEEDEAQSVEVIMQKKATVCPLVGSLSRKASNNVDPVSPHISVDNADTDLTANTRQFHIPSLREPTSPYNDNNYSLLVNLSDLENSLKDETSLLKDAMIKIKSERDKLRHDKLVLAKQLTFHERLLNAE